MGRLAPTIYTTAALQYPPLLRAPRLGGGRQVAPERVPNLWLVPAALGLALLVAAAYTTRAHAPSPGGVAATLIAAMLVYSGLIVLLDPFADATDEANCLLGVDWPSSPCSASRCWSARGRGWRSGG